MKSKCFVFFLLLIPGLFSSCSVIDPGPSSAPMGQIWMDFGDFNLRFTSIGSVGEPAASSYYTSSRFVNIYRQLSPVDFRSAQLKLLDVDLDKISTPATLKENVMLVVTISNNDNFESGTDGITLRLESKDNDVIRGTFSGVLRDTGGNNRQVRIANGSFQIRLNRVN